MSSNHILLPITTTKYFLGITHVQQFIFYMYFGNGSNHIVQSRPLTIWRMIPHFTIKKLLSY